MSLVHSVAKCLTDVSLQGKTVTVRGWVKTRRDSKAGLSFINLHDGLIERG